MGSEVPLDLKMETDQWKIHIKAVLTTILKKSLHSSMEFMNEEIRQVWCKHTCYYQNARYLHPLAYKIHLLQSFVILIPVSICKST